jgi:hypothetical protein
LSTIPLPALAVQPPQQPQNPLEQYGNLVRLQSLLGSQQLQRQQIQQNALSLQDQENVRKFAPNYIQKDANGKITGYDTDGYFNALMGAGVNPSTITTMRNQQAEAIKNQAAAGSAQLDLQDKKNDQAYQILEGVRSTVQAPNVDPNTIQTAYRNALPRLQQLGIDTSQYPAQFPGSDALDRFEAGLGMHKQIIADAKTVAETQKNAAQAALDQIKVNLSRNSKPGDFDNVIDQAAPPNGANAALNQRTKGLVNFALQRGDIDSANRAITEMSNQLGAVEKETNPQVQAGKVAVATAEGQARANIEAQMLRGSNAAVSNVPPHLVAAATADATKAGTEFAQAQSVTQRLNAMMQAARQGNVIAYQVIPEEGTLQITTSQGVHRINKTEIDQYAGGGSAWDRLVGHVGRQLTGQSIPSNVLDDMARIQQIQADGARSKYENSLKVINQSYGSTFKPVDIGQNANAPAPTPQSHDFSLSAWQRANPGGNAAAAKAAAIQQGYRVVP